MKWKGDFNAECTEDTGKTKRWEKLVTGRGRGAGA
jgi:hypothetical protein